MALVVFFQIRERAGEGDKPGEFTQASTTVEEFTETEPVDRAQPEKTGEHDTGSGAEPPACSLRSEPVATAQRDEGDSLMPHQLREELRELQPTLIELGRLYEEAPFSELDFPLFADQRVRLAEVNHRVLGDESGVFTARVAGGLPGSHVVLSYVGGAISGTIHAPSQGIFYEIRNASGENQSYLTEIDPEKVPECGLHGY